MKLKKWLVFLMVLAFSLTHVYAFDDEDEDEQEEAIKKSAKRATVTTVKKAAKEAPESSGGFKLGFYGTLVGGNTLSELIALTSEGGEDGFDINNAKVGQIGALFDIGNGLEISLGIGITRASVSVTVDYNGTSTTSDGSLMLYELVPGISYQLGKNNFIKYGAGLDISLSSWSITQDAGGTSVTYEPSGMTFAFTPNFYVKAEVVKDFYVHLKTGLVIALPPTEEDGDENYSVSTSTTIIGTKTEIGVSYYIF